MICLNTAGSLVKALQGLTARVELSSAGLTSARAVADVERGQETCRRAAPRGRDAHRTVRHTAPTCYREKRQASDGRSNDGGALPVASRIGACPGGMWTEYRLAASRLDPVKTPSSGFPRVVVERSSRRRCLRSCLARLRAARARSFDFELLVAISSGPH
jgi:hypothetical protein